MFQGACRQRRANPLLSGKRSATPLVCRRVQQATSGDATGPGNGTPIDGAAGLPRARLADDAQVQQDLRPVFLAAHDVTEGAVQQQRESAMQWLVELAQTDLGDPERWVGALSAHRKRIRTLEKETASMQRQYEVAKVSMDHTELVAQALVSRVESLQRELAQGCEELVATRQSCVGQCVACMERPASHLVVPCGHLALCQQCSWLASSRCPLCRQGSERVIRVFQP